ncbi:MAG: hypothetical protein WA822_17415 [Albidovulum sp.]
MALRALLIVFSAILFLAAPIRASSVEIADISAALKIDEMFAVISEEGQASGGAIEEDMFPGAGGARWADAVRGIYATKRILPIFHDAFATALNGPKVDRDAMLSFFTSTRGARLINLELSARRALLDAGVEEASRETLEIMRAEGDPRLDLIETFVEVNDLVEANVSGMLNANYAFFQGLNDARSLGPEMDDGSVLAEIWQQEAAIRDEMDIWIHSYLALAYAPVSDADLRAYIDFSRTEPGQHLNRALFAGFDAVLIDISRQLGRAAGAAAAGQDL